MAFNKIQPEQLQMPVFFSDSGSLSINQTETGIILNLMPNITGDFAFTGEMLTNGKNVFGLPNTGSNSFAVESGNLLFGGSNTEIPADVNNGYNIAIYANNCDISGLQNVLINGDNVDFRTGSLKNVGIAGNNLIFDNTATGCVALTDQTTDTLVVEKPHTFTAQFKSGHYFEDGELIVNNNASFGASGIFSGNLNILGSGMITGHEIITKNYLTGYASGNFVNTANDQNIDGTKRFQTGFQLPKWEGNGSQAGGSVPATGALAISGSTLCVFVGGSTWQGVEISGGSI